jgi:hypothetical protein
MLLSPGCRVPLLRPRNSRRRPPTGRRPSHYRPRRPLQRQCARPERPANGRRAPAEFQRARPPGSICAPRSPRPKSPSLASRTSSSSSPTPIAPSAPFRWPRPARVFIRQARRRRSPVSTPPGSSPRARPGRGWRSPATCSGPGRYGGRRRIPPSSSGDPRGRDEDLCRLIACLEHNQGVRRLPEEHGIRPDEAFRCLDEFCANSARP